MHRTAINSPTQADNENDFEFVLLSSAPGGGKSTTMLQETIDVPQVYAVVSPRIDLIDEQIAQLHERAALASVAPAIVSVHSRTPGATGKVEQRLRDALEAAASRHTIIVTTHAALMGLDPEDIVGLHIRWDENPEGAIASGRIGLAVSWPTMDSLYDLVPAAEAGWYRLVPRQGVEAVGFPRVRADVSRDVAELHRLARVPGRIVEVDVAAWADAAVPGRGKIRWRSIWSLRALRGCASLVLAAAGYEGSLAEHAVRRAGGARVVPVAVGAPRTGQPQIVIRYWTRQPGSTGWWATDAGKDALVAISRHLEAIEFDGYWATNSGIEDFFWRRCEAATRCSPKLAGSNALRECTSCALIYSAKATPDDEAIIAAFDLDTDSIQTAREDEDVYQFVCRGRIRDHAYDGAYSIRLHDEGQAVRLQKRLSASGFANVVVEADDGAGIMDVVRPPTTRRRRGATGTVETAAERKVRLCEAERVRGRKRRAEDKAKKIASGITPKRGRPKGSVKRPAA